MLTADMLAQYHGVGTAVGALDRSGRGRIAVSGPDRFTWLQGMVSNDTRLLADGAPALDACILNATGHLLADVRLVNHGDIVLLDIVAENRSKILAFLDQFLIAEDAELQDVTEAIGCISLQGPLVEERLIREQVGDSATVVAADHTGEGG